MSDIVYPLGAIRPPGAGFDAPGWISGLQARTPTDEVGPKAVQPALIAPGGILLVCRKLLDQPGLARSHDFVETTLRLNQEIPVRNHCLPPNSINLL
jgi:hypothetical protein